MFLGFHYGIGPFLIDITENKFELIVEEFEIDIEVVIE